MGSSYEHKQAAGWHLMINLAMVPAWAVVFWMLLTKADLPVWLVVAFAIPAVVMGFVLWTLSSLTVKVETAAVELWFGSGFFKKRFPLAEVRRATPVRNSWWYGWGIRLTPRGWLYNVGGFDAVELDLGQGRTVRIGTDEPDALARAVTRAREAFYSSD